MQVEFVGFDPSVLRELAEGRHAREVMELAKLKSEQAQYSASPIGEHRSMEGLGRVKMSIPPLAFHYWGKRLGYECWADKQFQDEYLRDNPSIRVKQAGGTRIQIGANWDGGAAKRFTKKYE